MTIKSHKSPEVSNAALPWATACGPKRRRPSFIWSRPSIPEADRESRPVEAARKPCEPRMKYGNYSTKKGPQTFNSSAIGSSGAANGQASHPITRIPKAATAPIRTLCAHDSSIKPSP